MPFNGAITLAPRPFRDADYPAFTELCNRYRPVVAQSKAALRAFDEAYKGDLLLNSDEASLSKVLYPTALERLEPHQPTALVVRIREDWTYWVDFYETRSFKEQERMWESRLELAAFDAEPLAGALEQASSAGVTITTLADLPDNEATQRLLYETVMELLSDVPFSEPLNIWPFAVWQERFWRSSARRPEGFFLAFHGAELVGVSELHEGPRPDWLGTGLTGVKRAYRGRGVAFALKLCAAQYAKAAGVQVISTRNHTGNRAMLAINEALGFVKQPTWLRLKKTL